MNRVFKFFLVCLLATTGLNLALGSTADRAQRFNLEVTKEFNKNITTIESMISYISKNHPQKAEEIKQYFISHKVPLETQIPNLKVDKDMITVSGVGYEKFQFTTRKNALVIHGNNGKKAVSLSSTPEEVAKIFDQFHSNRTSFQLQNLIIPADYAEGGIGEAIGIGLSGIGTAIAFGTLGVIEFVGKAIDDIASIPSDLMESRTRNQATQACEDIQNNKPVKDVAKIKKKLEELKEKVNCVKGWEEFMENSCAWFDVRIACLSAGSVEVKNDSRTKTKAVDKSNQEAPSKKSSAVSK